MPYKDPEKRAECSRQYRARNLEHCQARARKTSLRYYYANREAIITDLLKKWHSRSPEEVDAAKKRREEWYSRTVEQRREYSRKYYYNHLVERQAYLSKNRNRVTAMAEKRRKAVRDAEGDFCEHDIAAIFKKQYGLCFYCAGSLADGYDIDHKIPLSKGGSNWPSNLALACASCNRSKGAKTEGWNQHWFLFQG